jgi:4'-phosphopantetheinyl transferase
MDSASPEWPVPADTLSLDDEVHVWRAWLDVPTCQVESHLQTLSADERARADRFCFQRDRTQFIVARGLLRNILGRYLGLAPDQLCFAYTLHEKPALTEAAGAPALRFNVSHSHCAALIAVTHDREIGVDIERIRVEAADIEIARRYFSSHEVAALEALPAHSRVEAFFRCWTRKEAYIKARGGGLSIPLDQFDVFPVPGEPAVLRQTNADPQEAGHWSLRDLNPSPGYAAALAVEGHAWPLKCWHWSE